VGTLTQVKDPVKLSPVTLITDPRYMWPGAAGVVGLRTPNCAVLDCIAVVLDESVPCPPPGTAVSVFADTDGIPVAWTSEPIPRALGSVVENQRLDVADACHALGNGLRGTALGAPPGTSMVLVKVVIDGG
jgi:hypothetical protein